VLDLYAGSGAVGIEALSRGAETSVLVESDRGAAQTIRANLAVLDLPGGRLVTDRVERFAATPATTATTPFDVVFLDPPYAVTDDALRAVLTDLLANGHLADGALVVVERASRGGAFAWPAGVTHDRTREYGEAALWYGRAAVPGRAAGEGNAR
jgi:16S rRNA (guanine966-N2)-methyltransferase